MSDKPLSMQTALLSIAAGCSGACLIEWSAVPGLFAAEPTPIASIDASRSELSAVGWIWNPSAGSGTRPLASLKKTAGISGTDRREC